MARTTDRKKIKMSETPETTTGETTPEITAPAYSLHEPKFEVHSDIMLLHMRGHLVTDPCEGEDEEAPVVATFAFPAFMVSALIMDLLDTLKDLDPFTRFLTVNMLKDALSVKSAESGAEDKGSDDSPAMSGMIIGGSAGLGSLLGMLGIPVPGTDASESSSTPSGANEAKGDTPGMYM